MLKLCLRSLVLALIIASSGIGLASDAPLDLITQIRNVSTFECQPTTSDGKYSDWYAGIARSPGLNGSFWVTEGQLTSVAATSDEIANTVTLNFFSSTFNSFSVVLTPFTSVGAVDVVSALGLPDDTYVLNVVRPPNTDITLRTYNDLGDAGTYGASLPKLSVYDKSFVAFPASVGRRWLYVVVLDNASFYLVFYKYDGTLAQIEEINGARFPYGYLYKNPVGEDISFVVIERKPDEAGHPGGYDPVPMVLPYGTGVDNTTGAPNIFVASPKEY